MLLIYHQCVRHHCEGASFMVGQGPFFSVLTPVCTNPCCSLINLLPVQLNGSEFFYSQGLSSMQPLPNPPHPPATALFSDTHLQEGIHLHAGAHF